MDQKITNTDYYSLPIDKWNDIQRELQQLRKFGHYIDISITTNGGYHRMLQYNPPATKKVRVNAYGESSPLADALIKKVQEVVEYNNSVLQQIQHAKNDIYAVEKERVKLDKEIEKVCEQNRITIKQIKQDTKFWPLIKLAFKNLIHGTKYQIAKTKDLEEFN